MFAKLRNRFKDMHTIRRLCEAAEAAANKDGEPQPGLEHFVLAACALPEDRSANEALERLGATPEKFREAMAMQYRDALAKAGIAAPASSPDQIAPGKGLYQAKPQVARLMQALCDRPGKDMPLRGADVVAAVAAFEQGVAARAFAAMGIDRAALAQAGLGAH